jgi:N-acetylglutamate synthase-like GNAT family acetyltransferase
VGFEISTDAARVQFDVVHGWLATSYWCPNIRPDVLRRAIQNSLAFSAFDGVRQIGFARVVTDQATFAWLCDVFVDADFRHQGVASALVKAVMADARLATLRRICLATRDAHDVYRPLGFASVPADRWLEFLLPPSRWSEDAPDKGLSVDARKVER